MGKVDCFAVIGLRLWFNSNDHLPPRFQATKTEAWEIRIYFLRCSEGQLAFDIKWSRQPPGTLMNELLALVL